MLHYTALNHSCLTLNSGSSRVLEIMAAALVKSVDLGSLQRG